MTLKIQVSIESNPRCLCSRFAAITSDPKDREGWYGLSLLQEKITSSVLSILKCTFHCHAHNLTFSRSLFNLYAILFT